MFLVPGGTDVSPGSDASQASTIMNLLFAASPSLNTGWNTSIIGTTESLIDCGMMNECFVENVATNFMLCFVINFPREAPCKDEFDAAVGAFENGAGNVASCLATGAAQAASNAASNTVSSLLDRGNETTIETEDDFGALSSREQAELVLCLFDAALPGGALKEVKEVVVSAINTVKNIAVVAEPIIDIITQGLPGEVILFVFGWAEFQDGELVAPFKWWYCLFAVSMFVVGLEVCKILGTVFIIWTKR